MKKISHIIVKLRYLILLLAIGLLIPAAIGYSRASGIPYGEGLIKNRYVGRTFIMPTQEERELAVRLKLNPIKEAIKGKKIILIDDSIVRGTTSKQLLDLVKEAEPEEIHFLVGCPPVVAPCFYGVLQFK